MDGRAQLQGQRADRLDARAWLAVLYALYSDYSLTGWTAGASALTIDGIHVALRKQLEAPWDAADLPRRRRTPLPAPVVETRTEDRPDPPEFLTAEARAGARAMMDMFGPAPQSQGR